MKMMEIIKLFHGHTQCHILGKYVAICECEGGYDLVILISFVVVSVLTHNYVELIPTNKVDTGRVRWEYSFRKITPKKIEVTSRDQVDLILHKQRRSLVFWFSFFVFVLLLFFFFLL